MDHAKYKVLVHNELDSKGEIVSTLNPLGYSPSDEEQQIDFICEACEKPLPIIVRSRSERKPGGLNSVLFYLILFFLATLSGVLVAFAVGNSIIGVLIAVVVLGLLLMIFSEREPVKIPRKHDTYLEKEGINKRHEIKDMTPEFAEKNGIDPYKTF